MLTPQLAVHHRPFGVFHLFSGWTITKEERRSCEHLYCQHRPPPLVGMVHSPRGAKWNASGQRTWRVRGQTTGCLGCTETVFEWALWGAWTSVQRDGEDSAAVTSIVRWTDCFLQRLANPRLLCETPNNKVARLRVVATAGAGKQRVAPSASPSGSASVCSSQLARLQGRARPSQCCSASRAGQGEAL